MKQDLEDFETELLSIRELKDHLKRIKRNDRIITITLVVVSIIAIVLAIRV